MTKWLADANYKSSITIVCYIVKFVITYLDILVAQFNKLRNIVNSLFIYSLVSAFILYKRYWNMVSFRHMKSKVRTVKLIIVDCFWIRSVWFWIDSILNHQNLIHFKLDQFGVGFISSRIDRAIFGPYQFWFGLCRRRVLGCYCWVKFHMFTYKLIDHKWILLLLGFLILIISRIQAIIVEIYVYISKCIK